MTLQGFLAALKNVNYCWAFERGGAIRSRIAHPYHSPLTAVCFRVTRKRFFPPTGDAQAARALGMAPELAARIRQATGERGAEVHLRNQLLDAIGLRGLDVPITATSRRWEVAA